MVHLQIFSSYLKCWSLIAQLSSRPLKSVNTWNRSLFWDALSLEFRCRWRHLSCKLRPEIDNRFTFTLIKTTMKFKQIRKDIYRFLYSLDPTKHFSILMVSLKEIYLQLEMAGYILMSGFISVQIGSHPCTISLVIHFYKCIYCLYIIYLVCFNENSIFASGFQCSILCLGSVQCVKQYPMLGICGFQSSILCFGL